MWLNDMKVRRWLEIPHFLVGCQCDAISSRVVSREAAHDLALEYDAPYFETSALLNEGLEELFDAVAGYVYL